MMYFLLGVLAPIILNLLHLVVGVYVVTARGSVMSLGFTGMGFLTKTTALLWLTWLGVSIVELNYKIYMPLLTFVWFFTHLVEAFVIQHYMGDDNVAADDVCHYSGLPSVKTYNHFNEGFIDGDWQIDRYWDEAEGKEE